MSERRVFYRLAAGALLLLLGAGLCACGPDEKKGEEKGGEKTVEKAAAPAVVPPAETGTPRATPEPALTAEERARAESALDFHNTALNALETGYYALPDALYANARLYLKTWRLPRKAPSAGSRDAARARLKPASGLFSEEEAAKLTAALAGMDKALDSLLGSYKALEAYVADGSIRDDGVKGKALARKLEKDHEVFMAARKSWLEIVEARAAEAEAALLREHPLRRQIEAAGAIFAGFARVAEALGADEDAAAETATAPAGDARAGSAAAGRKDGAPAPATQPQPAQPASATLGAATRTTLEHIRTELENRIAEAAKPPFAAAPGLERQYRAFLKEATAYAEALGRGLDEGFFAPQRRELNVAAVRSRAAYNAFVREANGLRTR